jgi:hypothetical protein
MQNSTITKPTIKVEAKTHYGNTLYYPTDESQQRYLSILTKGQKTLTLSQCEALLSLGFNLDIVHHNPFFVENITK